ncbi:MAG: glutamate 5-kinase [Lachnospiraceae bacterium]|nr:glutamate 5-kinase [Lachnospiraceae bacterium]
MSENRREYLQNKKRIVIKIGSSSLQHKETGGLNFTRLDVLVREIVNLRNQGKDVVLVSSGAIAVGKKALRFEHDPNASEEKTLAEKQALAAVGQARLMMVYQKLFMEYNQMAAQILMTKHTVANPINRHNAENTFRELLEMGVVPIVNENDTVTTDEIKIGDNDTLSAIVASMIDADMLILLSDIEGLYTDDPRVNPEAKFISEVTSLDDEILQMGKGSTGSTVGTGGMNTKLIAAQIASKSGCDMVIASSEDIKVIHRIMKGKEYGTLFHANKDADFDLPKFIEEVHQEK